MQMASQISCQEVGQTLTIVGNWRNAVVINSDKDATSSISAEMNKIIKKILEESKVLEMLLLG